MTDPALISLEYDGITATKQEPPITTSHILYTSHAWTLESVPASIQDGILFTKSADNAGNFKIIGPSGHRYRVYIAGLSSTIIPAGWTQADSVTHLHLTNPTQDRANLFLVTNIVNANEINTDISVISTPYVIVIPENLG